MEAVTVIGIGPGGRDYLTQLAEKAIGKADVLVGGKRNLAQFPDFSGETFAVGNNLPAVVDLIRARRDGGKKVAVLASGDPGLFGILQFLRRHFTRAELEVIPGISAAQLACARLALPWQDAFFVSTHGRPVEHLLDAVSAHAKIVVFCSPADRPAEMARLLLGKTPGPKIVHLCADLSYPGETIQTFTLPELAGYSGDLAFTNMVMVITDA